MNALPFGGERMNRRRLLLAATLSAITALVISACFPDIPELATSETAGNGGAGGSDSGSDSGGSDSGGSDSGGSDSGGSDSGGSDSGGSDSGGSDAGGSDSGSETGSDVGPAGAAGAAGAAGSGAPCPADMVHAEDTALGVSFCIDRTEATETQYIAFLMAVSSDPAQTDQPPECAFNDSLAYTPDGSCPDFATGSDVPVRCIDWCDAYAYCAFRGKRLCGALNGGSLALDAPVTSDEWHFACTGGFKTKYPYGDDPIVGACNIPQENTSDPSDDNQKAPVGSFADCEGGFPGIFDMQGNVNEWTDRCEPGVGTGEELCMARGGNTYGTADYWRCNNLVSKAPRNDPGSRQTGVRCCADAQ
jgi:formylglycine-generating enzyme required for sulfatase activity